jgi:acetyl-CoA carboxylase biotin carboxyl carrier protein
VSLTAADVAEIMRLVEQSGFDELTLEIDGMKLSLRRGASAESSVSGAAQVLAAAVPILPVAETSAVSSASAPRSVESTVPADPNVHDVTSPLLGTFYRAPKPGAPPFVEVGAPVDEETVVAIIEVMKLMNTVRAGVRGTVTEILLGDGALAEYGETLLRVRKSG